MNKILISIITITYNDLKGLITTIDSIDKNFKSLNNIVDHIIIDGNSNDGTKEYMLKKINSRSINTHFVSETDFGIYDAMNKGVLNSSSDFVIFINSGDILLSSFFSQDLHERLNLILDNRSYAGLALSCIYNFNWKKIIVKPRNVSLSLPRMPSLHQGIIYKRLILVEIPYSTKFRICGDFENICRIIKKYKFDTLDIKVSELIAGGVSTLKPFSLARESYFIFISNFSPNLFEKILYITKLGISLSMVQFLYISSKFIKRSYL